MKCELCGAPVEKGKCIYCGKKYNFSCETGELSNDTIALLLHEFGELSFRNGEDVYQFCEKSKHGRYSPKKTLTTKFDILLKELDPDELILFPFIGLHNYNKVSEHDGMSAYLVTSKRIMFVYKKPLTFNHVFGFIRWTSIYDIDKETKIVSNILKIFAANQFLKVKDAEITGEVTYQDLLKAFRILGAKQKPKGFSSFIPENID